MGAPHARVLAAPRGLRHDRVMRALTAHRSTHATLTVGRPLPPHRCRRGGAAPLWRLWPHHRGEAVPQGLLRIRAVQEPRGRGAGHCRHERPGGPALALCQPFVARGGLHRHRGAQQSPSPAPPPPARPCCWAGHPRQVLPVRKPARQASLTPAAHQPAAAGPGRQGHEVLVGAPPQHPPQRRADEPHAGGSRGHQPAHHGLAWCALPRLAPTSSLPPALPDSLP